MGMKGQIDMTKVMVAFRYFAKTPKNLCEAVFSVTFRTHYPNLPVTLRKEDSRRRILRGTTTGFLILLCGMIIKTASEKEKWLE